MNILKKITYVMFILFLCIIAITSDNNIIPDFMPDMPLYRDIIMATDRNDFPIITYSLEPLSENSFKVLSTWRNDIGEEMQAKIYKDQLVFLYHYFDDPVLKILFVKNGKEYNGIANDDYNNLLLSDTNIPTLLSWSFSAEAVKLGGGIIFPQNGSIKNPGFKQFTTVEIIDDEIRTKEINPPKDLKDLGVLYTVSNWDDDDVWLYEIYSASILKEYKMVIERSIEGESFQTDNFIIIIVKDRYDDEIVDDNYATYSKATYDKTTKSLSITEINVPENPAVFSGVLKGFVFDKWSYTNINRPKIWHDGSIIYTARYVKDIGDEFAVFKCLLRDKGKDNPEVLNWTLEYSYYNENSGYWANHTNSAFSFCFYPNSYGTVSSVHNNSATRIELILDIDRAHNSIIFLKGGQPWQLILSE